MGKTKMQKKKRNKKEKKGKKKKSTKWLHENNAMPLALV